jgi:predicted nucleic acid-binding Zn ribbon protein
MSCTFENYCDACGREIPDGEPRIYLYLLIRRISDSPTQVVACSEECAEALKREAAEKHE